VLFFIHYFYFSRLMKGQRMCDMKFILLSFEYHFLVIIGIMSIKSITGKIIFLSTLF